MSVRYDFDLPIGSSWPFGNNKSLTGVLKQGPDRSTLTPVNLTGATITASISESENGVSLSAPLVAILDQNVDPGKWTFRIPSAQTENLKLRTYFYRVWITWTGSDSEITVLAGKIRLTSGV